MESETNVWGIHTSSSQILTGALPKAHHVNMQEWCISIPNGKRGESAASTSQGEQCPLASQQILGHKVSLRPESQLSGFVDLGWQGSLAVVFFDCLTHSVT